MSSYPLIKKHLLKVKCRVCEEKNNIIFWSTYQEKPLTPYCHSCWHKNSKNAQICKMKDSDILKYCIEKS